MTARTSTEFWYPGLRQHPRFAPAVPVQRLEVEGWCRMGAVMGFDRGDRVYVPQRATTTAHDGRCDCEDCGGQVGVLVTEVEP